MIKLFKNLSKKDYLFMFMSFLLVAFQVWLELKIPDYMSLITKLIQTGSDSMGDILLQGGKMLLCAFGSLITAVIVGYFASIIAANSSYILRDKIFKKVQKYSMREIKKFKTGSLITRTTNDVTQIETFISMGMQMMFRAPIMAIFAITKIVNKNMEWSLLTASGVVILLITISVLMIVVIPRFEIVQNLIDKMNGVTRENLTGIRVIRAFNAENYQENKFENVNEDLTKNHMFIQKSLAIMSPIMNFIMHSLTLGIYFVGAYLIMNATISNKINLFSEMIVFSSYGIQVIMSFLMLAIVFMILPRANVSARRINEVLDEKFSIKDGLKSIKKTDEVGTVEFKNVSFKYPDAGEYLLKNISFKINKGETVAFIGSTGSGKSTLVNLIPRFYDVTSGEVLVDNINVKEYTLESLYNKLGYISQKAVLFKGTVKSNVSFGYVNNKILIYRIMML